MCGIFGVISNKKIKTEKLKKVSKVIRHRGPDDAGFLLFNNEEHKPYLDDDSIKEIKLPILQNNSEQTYSSAFLHRRLSIIDLSANGHQPMSYADEKLWIVFNGEIYNYLEVKKELEENGYTFRSESDTEVILAAYKMWGQACVEKFNGMWAFAIWDKEKDLVFISRDRFGVKPLYYYHKNNEFVFCSEIKGIKEYIDNGLNINKEQIIYFALEGQTREGIENTVFSEIRQLLPGHSLIYRQGEIKINKFWEIKLKENNQSFSQNVEEFTSLFRQSLVYRMRSDVPVGSCLSGGIDSSSIVSFASKEFKTQFHTFSAVWPGEKCDESAYIQTVNNKWNCIPHSFTPAYNDEFLNIINELIWHQEIPLPGGSLIAQWFVMKEAKNAGVKVLLDGQGADEILSGYPRYITTYINEMLYSFKWGQIINTYSHLSANGYSLKQIAGIQRNKFSGNTRQVIQLKKDIKTAIVPLKKNYSFNYVPEYLKYEIEQSCLPALLHFEDRNSMAHSVETRIPFLDYKLAEFCVNIPTKQKIKGVLTKTILREAMKGIIPDEVYNRTDKIGFETPIEKKINGTNTTSHTIMLDVINRSKIRELDLFDNSVFEPNNYKQEFRLYSLAKFLEQWI